ncbi:hypothetical protein AMTRI_Chr09g38560 [Amborella trichopoda]|uniref:DUF4228 domain-containing protein n=1 Tax=Amborella trichopoda TaxID=13333 RepID=W1NRM0_AMBTC|nr:uncharacterized protein LOC18426540 [Amborella trichopoda]ERM98527.1 hypothetical protein AMTR_s00113p00094690 [Amborella trichopoda]|eukprot:XP_006833249.1 uncharacterized protein LOC18426540 [Amborella trichopoda]
MGNCVLVPQATRPLMLEAEEENIVRIAKTDGKILEYRAPLVVEQVLTTFEGQALYTSGISSDSLSKDYRLKPGQPYYLMPNKTVEEPASTEEQGLERESGGVVRLKVVITKQQLQELLAKSISVADVISSLRNMEDGSNRGHSRGWRPCLETIHEDGGVFS